MLQKWNTGRGKRAIQTPRIIFFCMLVVVCKHGGQWNLLRRMFSIKGPAFERLISRFLLAVLPIASHVFVDRFADHFRMRKLLQRNTLIKTYKLAWYASALKVQKVEWPPHMQKESRLEVRLCSSKVMPCSERKAIFGASHRNGRWFSIASG